VKKTDEDYIAHRDYRLQRIRYYVASKRKREALRSEAINCFAIACFVSWHDVLRLLRLVIKLQYQNHQVTQSIAVNPIATEHPELVAKNRVRKVDNRKQIVDCNVIAGHLRKSIGFSAKITTDFRKVEITGNWRNSDGKLKRNHTLRYRCQSCKMFASRRFSKTIENFVATDIRLTPAQHGFTCTRQLDDGGKCPNGEYVLARYSFTGRESERSEDKMTSQAIGRKVNCLPVRETRGIRFERITPSGKRF
jgi:hypothetical protein